MKKYLWAVHIVAGSLALFESILTDHDFSRLGTLLAVFSVSALFGLVVLHVTENRK